MAGKTIDDLEEFSPTINEQLRDGSTTPDKLVVPARVKRPAGEKSRTIQITLDNPLMLPELPQHGDSFDEYYGGSALRSAGNDRHWANVRVVWALNKGSVNPHVGLPVVASGALRLYYPQRETVGNKKRVDLEDYTDFCVLYGGGYGTDLSPWYSLDAARADDRDLDMNEVANGGYQGFFNYGPQLRVHPRNTGVNTEDQVCISARFQTNYANRVYAILVR